MRNLSVKETEIVASRPGCRACRFILLSLVAFVCLVSPVAAAPEAVFVSHFEDSLSELHGWSVNLPAEGGAVSVRHLEEGVHRVALVVTSEGGSEPLRIAQSGSLFSLEPGKEYVLRVTYRAPRLVVQSGGRVRFMVTNARWTWAAPALTLASPDETWKTATVQFAAPEDQSPNGYRVRFEAIKAQLDLEIAEISVVAL